MAAPTAALSPRTRAAREMMTDGSFCSDVCVRVGAQGEAMALHRVQVRPKGCRGVPWAASVRAPLRMARRSLMRVDTHTDKCIQRQRARRGRCLGAHGAASCCPTRRGSDAGSDALALNIPIPEQSQSLAPILGLWLRSAGEIWCCDRSAMLPVRDQWRCTDAAAALSLLLRRLCRFWWRCTDTPSLLASASLRLVSGLR